MKQLPEQNGITPYTDGTLDSGIFDVCTLMHPTGAELRPIANVVDLLGRLGVAEGSAKQGYYRWRKYHGRALK